MLGLALWMGTWWLTACVPLEATSLLPLAVLPLTGAATMDRAASPYANPIIFLFLGGFFVAAALERWRLHQRIAWTIVGAVGTGARSVVAAFMGATAFLSMWISNTATAVMMLPIAAAVLRMSESPEARAAGGAAAPPNLGPALMLGVAYAASLGGMATLIGTPPNAIFAATASQLYGTDVGFARWAVVGLPCALILLPFCWWSLTGWLLPVKGPVPGLGAALAEARRRLGRMGGPERFTLVVFACTALAWAMREPKSFGALTVPGLSTWIPAVSDAGIAIAAALVLFTVPLSLSRGTVALDWPTASRVPWGILLLFGGGLSLADAFQASGLSVWVGGLVEGFAGTPRFLLYAAVGALFVLLGEFASNTAMAAMAMPLMASAAPALGVEPLVLMQVVALATSVGFMLPVATPPNAVAFATGHVTTRQMARAGLWLDLAGVLVVAAAGALLL